MLLVYRQGGETEGNVTILDLRTHQQMHLSGLQQVQSKMWLRGHWCKCVQAPWGFKSSHTSHILLKSLPSRSTTRRCEGPGYGLILCSKSSNNEAALKWGLWKLLSFAYRTRAEGSAAIRGPGSPLQGQQALRAGHFLKIVITNQPKEEPDCNIVQRLQRSNPQELVV